jgi:hypothetical protein
MRCASVATKPFCHCQELLFLLATLRAIATTTTAAAAAADTADTRRCHAYQHISQGHLRVVLALLLKHLLQLLRPLEQCRSISMRQAQTG